MGAKPTPTLWVEHVGGKPKPTAAKPSANRHKMRFASPKGELPEHPADQPGEGPAYREEAAKLLGFSRNEAIAAVQVTVREIRAGRGTSYEVIRLLDTTSDRVVETFRHGAPSSAPEWQAARPTEAWNVLASRSELASHRLNMEKSNIRMAIDPGDKVRAESNKTRILIRGETGGALGMTPVVRLYDQRNVWLGAMRVAATPGRAITAEVEAFHSRTGMHVAVIAHYTSTAGFSEKKTDVVRVFAMPGDPIGTTTIGGFNMTLASEAIGERKFDELNPGFEEAFDKFGKD
ncbi:MAG: hypothetical protein ACAI38_11550 [Myxococcota bacterium]